MAQNCRGFGGEAFRAAGGGLAGDGSFVTAPAALSLPWAAADLHPEQHMCQCCQTGPPARINQLKLCSRNKPQELSCRGLVSACSACPDLNADLRASLALQPQRTAEKGSRLRQAPTKGMADRTALRREPCQLQAFIPTPAVTALPEVTTLLPLTSPATHRRNKNRESCHGMRGRPMFHRGSKRTTNPPTEAQRELWHPRDDVCPQPKKCPNLFPFKPVLQSGLDWDSCILCGLHNPLCPAGDDRQAPSALQPQRDCRCPKTRAKPAHFLSVTLPTAGWITWWFLCPFPALRQHQLLHTGWTGFTHFLWSLEQL